jgi:hypothetical protein
VTPSTGGTAGLRGPEPPVLFVRPAAVTGPASPSDSPIETNRVIDDQHGHVAESAVRAATKLVVVTHVPTSDSVASGCSASVVTS